MPPSPNNVDGIKPPAPAPTGPPRRPINQPQPVTTQNASAAPAAPAALHNTVDLKAEAATVAIESVVAKSRPNVSKKTGGPVVPVLITLIVMVILIGLAYFAYNNSK
jgi:hypothetical protein